MPEKRQQQWQDILQMTQQMQQLSAEENWQAMIDLDVQRLVMLQDFFSNPVTESEAAEVATGIREILDSDQKLMQTGKAMQQEMSATVQKISTSRQAIKAYSHFQK